MSLSQVAVKRAITFSMIYVVIIGFGIFCLTQLKLDLFPNLKFPTVVVINDYKGVGPKEVETLVTRPIEMAVSSVKNVQRIRSTSKLGSSISIVDLAWGCNVDQAMMDIREKIDLVKKQIPEEAREPLIFAFDPSLQPIMIISINSSTNLTELRQFISKRISPLLERVEGVASATVVGGNKREIQVLLDSAKLQSFGLSPTQVIQALRANNVQIASGTLSQHKQEFPIQLIGTFDKIEQIRNVVIGMKGKPIPQPIYVRNVARVIDTFKENTRVIESNGKQGMLLLVQKRSDANTVQVANRISKVLPELEKRLPVGTKLGVLFDQSDIITKSLSNLNSSVFQAFFLAVLVLLFFLRSFRSSFIIAVSIPVSGIATFSAMYAANVTLNIISMAGLALAVGMLVDNSIVVLENIYRHFEDGKSPADASIAGSDEVSVSIMASTLTTLAVFIPILFVPGIAGALFRDMVITICFSLSVSLLVAVTLIPLLGSKFLKASALKQAESSTSWINRTISFLLKMIDGFFVGLLRKSLAYRKTSISIGLASFVLAMVLAKDLKTDFLPKTDDGMIVAQFERSPGTSIEETMKTARWMEKIARKHFESNIEAFIVEAGIDDGFIALFGKGSYAGLFRLRLKSMGVRTHSKEYITNFLRKKFSKIPDLTVNFQGFDGAATGGIGDIDIQIFGHDLKEAKILAEKIKLEMQKVEGAADVRTTLEQGTPEIQILLKRTALQRLGLNPFSVGQTVSAAFKGTVASLFRQKGDEYNILVRLEEKYRKNIGLLKKLLIVTPNNKTVTLDTIADVRYILGPVKIERQDQQRVGTVAINVQGQNLGKVLERVRARLKAKILFPPDFYYRIGGKAEDFITSFQWLGIALLISILLVYMVMASQFESLFEPFIILFSIPLSAIGIVSALLLTDTSLSVTALIGLVMLVGIVVNNAIVLMDYINLLRREKGYSILEAAQTAGEVRLRPILMTAATTILGMLPLALGIGEGSETWAGLGRVVMGGLFASTFLTIALIPTIYASTSLFFEKIKNKRTKKNIAA